MAFHFPLNRGHLTTLWLELPGCVRMQVCSGGRWSSPRFRIWTQQNSRSSWKGYVFQMMKKSIPCSSPFDFQEGMEAFLNMAAEEDLRVNAMFYFPIFIFYFPISGVLVDVSVRGCLQRKCVWVDVWTSVWMDVCSHFVSWQCRRKRYGGAYSSIPLWRVVSDFCVFKPQKRCHRLNERHFR